MIDSITDIETLESRLSNPPDYVIESLCRAPGDTVILGVGGKMGPTLARMLVRACRAADDGRTITAVSRFTNVSARNWLEDLGIKTIAADLLDERTLPDIPDAANVISMTGQKFGTANNAPATWAMNTDLPSADLSALSRLSDHGVFDGQCLFACERGWRMVEGVRYAQSCRGIWHVGTRS
ncbi:MAG: hypothetical protein R3C05_08735 [Pirellulaceae bacterium]